MAIVLPLFAILLLGAFEFGSIAHDYQALQNAAREGARFSANLTNCISGSSNPSAVLATIQNRVIAYLQGEKITVNRSDVTVDQNYLITIGTLTVMGSHVTINYQRSLIFPGITSLIPSSTIQLQGNAVFRNFY
jgi:Flp pilus assembly protein TadG